MSDRDSTHTGSRRLPLIDTVLGIVLFGAVLAAYVCTLAPGLLLNDSGEFQTLAYTVGHTHPTGYPVYILLANLATRLPIESVAWRVNLFSAICGAAAAVQLFVLLRLLTGRRWLAALAAAQLALSPTFWSQSIIAEVYVPAAAMMCGVLLLLLNWRHTGRTVMLIAAAALGGLSLGVHLTVALMAPAAVLFVLLERQSRMRNVAAAVAGAAAGVLLTWLAFVVVDRNNPLSDYYRAVVEPSCSEWDLQPDQIDDLSERLRFSLPAVQYRDNLRRRSIDDLFAQASEYLHNLPNELPWLWLAVAGIGTIRLILADGRFALLVLGTLAAHVLYVARHNMGDIQVAYIPTYVILAILAGCCLGVKRPVYQPRTGPSAPRRGRTAFETCCVIALLLSTLLPLFGDHAWTDEGRRAVWVPEGEPPFEVEYSDELSAALSAIVADLEPNAILFCEWSHLYAFYYVAHVELERTDLTFIQAYPAIGQTRLAEPARQMIRTSFPTRPVYLIEPLPELMNEYEFEAVERGGRILFRVGARDRL